PEKLVAALRAARAQCGVFFVRQRWADLGDVGRGVEPFAAAFGANDRRDQAVLGEREGLALQMGEAPVGRLADRPGRTIERACAAKDAGRMKAVESEAGRRAGESDGARRAQLLAQQAALAAFGVEFDAGAQALG